MSRGVVAVVAAVALVAGVLVCWRLLKPPTGRWPALEWPSILQVQRATSGHRMVAVMEQLDGEGRKRLLSTLLADMLVIAGYVTLLLCGVAWSEDVVHSSLSGAAVVAVGAAGAFDAVENIALAVVLTRWADYAVWTGTPLSDARRTAAGRWRTLALIARIATDVKWVLLTLVVLWLLVVSVVALAP